jgi:formylglycine-generating enzyme required for sulfatase activity
MRFLFSLLLLFSFFRSHGETPEKIYPKTKIIKSIEWYAHQASLWKEKASQAPGDAHAWLNYFIAAKYSLSTDQELSSIVESSAKAVPETFEYHFIKSVSSPFSQERFDHLLKAYQMQPENPSLYSELVQMNEFLHNTSSRKEFSRKLFQSGLVSQSLLNYSYNVLMSIEENAILFTDSDNTTLPIYLLQDVIGTRTDVTVLNLDMLVQDEYRAAKLASLNLNLSSYISSSRQELCTLLPEQNPTRVFYYALTLSKDNILSIKDQLYVVGLASQLSTQRVDNITAIKNNLENRFLLDYLTVDFNGEGEHSAGKVLNANYIVPMLLLLEHYRASKDEEKAKALEQQIMEIARQSGKSLLVENFLNRKESDEVPYIPYKIEAKEIEGHFKLVKDKIYAHEYEVTNMQYNEFLQYLQENNLTDLYEKCKIQLSQYEEPALSFMTGYHSNRQPTKKEKYFLMHPVINITYEAAQEYCKWLTDQYNNTSERKYKKVKFRLPSIDEWQIAAASLKNAKSWKLEENTAEVKVFEEGHDVSKKYEKKTVSLSDPEILYPWFRYWGLRKSPLNSRGCSLGNFKYPESQKPCQASKMNTADGFLLMAPVQSYFPNDIGLYDVVGNVSEMTDEKGKACGGSWNHPPDQSTIRSVNEYTKANSDTGFRIFMEVLEP